MPLDQPESATRQLAQEVRMTFGEHIEELRKRLILCLIGVAVALVAAFLLGFRIMVWLAEPLVQALDVFGFPPQVYVRDPTLGFGVYIKVSLIAAVVFASPWIIYQLWLFVVAGLYESEKRTVHILAPFSTAMTVLAVLFTRYVLLPASVLFFVRFATLYPQIEPGEPGWMIRLLAPAAEALPGDEDEPPLTLDPPGTQPLRLPVLATDPASPGEGDLWINGRERRLKVHFAGATHTLSTISSRLLGALPEIGDYVRFAALVGLGNVIAFQLPVIMLIAGWTGIIPPQDIARYRKYALFACAALAAVLTPADIVSMTVLMLPLYGLFEFGLLLMRWVYREPKGWSDGDGGGPE